MPEKQPDEYILRGLYGSPNGLEKVPMEEHNHLFSVETAEELQEHVDAHKYLHDVRVHKLVPVPLLERVPKHLIA